jgi:hypothetical protein
MKNLKNFVKSFYIFSLKRSSSNNPYKQSSKIEQKESKVFGHNKNKEKEYGFFSSSKGYESITGNEQDSLGPSSPSLFAPSSEPNLEASQTTEKKNDGERIIKPETKDDGRNKYGYGGEGSSEVFSGLGPTGITTDTKSTSGQADFGSSNNPPNNSDVNNKK